MTVHQEITTHVCSAIALLVNQDYWIICITLLFTWMSHNYVIDSQDTQTTNTPKQESQAPEDYFSDMEQEIEYAHKEAGEYSPTFASTASSHLVLQAFGQSPTVNLFSVHRASLFCSQALSFQHLLFRRTADPRSFHCPNCCNLNSACLTTAPFREDSKTGRRQFHRLPW